MILQNALKSGAHATHGRSLARFHFIAGLPRSGMAVLAALLHQNPRFVTMANSPAHAIFTGCADRLRADGPEANMLNDAQKIALLRGGIDAVYHDRPQGSVVFDANRDWLDNLDDLVRLYPLCRFIICVRNPAAIVNSVIQTEHTQGQPDVRNVADIAAQMTADKGAIGREIGRLRRALSARHAERIFVLDYDRLVDDPEDVIDVLYDFLREPEFDHDFDDLGVNANAATDGISGPVRRSNLPMILPPRVILQLSGRAFWRNLRRTSATLMLGRGR